MNYINYLLEIEFTSTNKLLDDLVKLGVERENTNLNNNRRMAEIDTTIAAIKMDINKRVKGVL